MEKYWVLNRETKHKKYASQIDKIAPQNIYTDSMCQSDKSNYRVLILTNYWHMVAKQVEKIFNTVWSHRKKTPKKPLKTKTYNWSDAERLKKNDRLQTGTRNQIKFRRDNCSQRDSKMKLQRLSMEFQSILKLLSQYMPSCEVTVRREQ